MKSAPATRADAVMPWTRTRQRLRQWWLDRHPPRDHVVLHQRNLYILPTRAGWMLCLTLLVLLLASINYQLNLGYLLTFLIAGCALVSTWVCHRNMLALELHALPPTPVFAGQPAQVQIQIHNPTKHWRYALSLGLIDSQSGEEITVDAAPQGSTTVNVVYTPLQRGRNTLPTLGMQTLYPLGIFRVWTVWRPAATLLVYPAPESKPPSLPEPEPTQGAQAPVRRTASGTEFDGVRPYRRGDPLKWIAWKKISPCGDLYSKEQLSLQGTLIWLDLRQARTGELETDLERLCAWLLKAESQAHVYGLKLPHLEIPPGSGVEHRNRCLEALALC
jgi:uncharacterized protein (DUF58 family)